MPPARPRSTARPSRRPFSARDLMKQVMIQELAVAPDGSSIVYAQRTVEAGKYRKRLWRTTFRGGRPEQLTTSDASDGRPRFSPDGATLLFLSDRSGSSQPWLMPVAGGEPRRAADVPGDVSAADWSPDGKRIVLLAPSGVRRFLVGDPKDPIARRITDYTWRLDGLGYRDEFTSVWMVAATGGKPRRVTGAGHDVTQAFWSQDGRRIGFLADLRPEAALEEQPRAWSVSAGGTGPPKELAALEGSIFGAAWGPGGELAFIGNARKGSPEWANADLFVAHSNTVRQLGTELDTWIANTSYGDLIDSDTAWPPTPVWLDERNIVALAADRGAAHPHRFGLDGSVERLASGDDVICTSIATGGGRVAVVASVDGPGEVFAVEDGRLRRLTTGGSRWYGPFGRTPERVAVPHPDGHEIDGWLLRAKGSRRPGRLVIDVHGGPHGSFGPVPWLEMVALADAGIHVLWTNPRGSTGYGEKFARTIDGAWGDADGDDVQRVVAWAVKQGLADPARVGVMGLSYGGFMTNWLLGHVPGVFAAGVSENPVTDMIGEFGSSDFGRTIGSQAAATVGPWESLASLLERSPYVHIHRNESPLLLLQSEADLRCPPGQSELVFTILRSLGRTVEMVRYPDESHILLLSGRPDRRVDRIERIVGWFTRHLGARSSR